MTFEDIQRKRQALRAERKELESQVQRLEAQIKEIETIEDRLMDEWDRTYERATAVARHNRNEAAC